MKPTRNGRRKIALVDIDRTLAEGSIGVLFVHYLHKKGLFPDSSFKIIQSAVSRNNAGIISYQKRGEIIIKSWAKGFRGWNKLI
jgi:hypothetical protein